MSLFFPLCRVLNRDESIAKELFKQGKEKDAHKDYKGAIADYTKAIEQRPDYAEAYYGRGHAELNLKDYQGAIADNTLAIKLKPDYADAYQIRGAAKSFLEDNQGAVVDYDKAITLKPDGLIYFRRGLSYLYLLEKGKARADFMRAIEFGQRVPQNYLDMCK